MLPNDPGPGPLLVPPLIRPPPLLPPTQPTSPSRGSQYSLQPLTIVGVGSNRMRCPMPTLLIDRSSGRRGRPRLSAVVRMVEQGAWFDVNWGVNQWIQASDPRSRRPYGRIWDNITSSPAIMHHTYVSSLSKPPPPTSRSMLLPKSRLSDTQTANPPLAAYCMPEGITTVPVWMCAVYRGGN